MSFAFLKVLILAVIFSFFAFGQLPSCSSSARTLLVHQEGLAERIGDITLSCTGGQAAAGETLTLFVSLNTNITNRLDVNGVPQGISVTANTGSGPVATGAIALTSGTTLSFSGLNYTVPVSPATPVIIAVSGLRAAVASLSNGSAPSVVTATLQGIGAQFATVQPVTVAISAPTLLQSSLNNGVPCNGATLPATPNFLGFAAYSPSSTVRITEASAAAFSVKSPGDDTGVRILVNVTGYGAGARVFVPDAVVGSTGNNPTSAGAFGISSAAGTYAPASGQLLLVRVNGADATGAGGTLATAQPAALTTFSSVSEVTVTSGSALAVYEVLDSNTSSVESAQLPVFVSVPQTSCPSTLMPSVTAALGPVSAVSIATATDPIPRFIASPLSSDCRQLNDCGASYYPALIVDNTPVKLTAASAGNKQSAFIRVGNTGAGMLNFTTSISYPAGAPAASWLTLSPASGVNNVSIQAIADPSALPLGIYTAVITVSAGAYGSATVPVTFTVGGAGVTISNVGNAASFQYGTVAPGSYAVLYGANLAGKNVSVTFNGLPAAIVYDSATQINLIVPAALSGQLGAAVIATIDGSIGNTFKVSLAPNSPGIFNSAIVNFADGTVNSADHPATRGTIITVYLTGLTIPLTGQVTVNIAGQTNLTPTFAGAQPTLPALDQVNIVVPAALPVTPNPVPLQVCIPGVSGQPVCSNQVNLYIR